MYYYDQNNYYYYNQNQYYDQDSYYNYGNYNGSHRTTSTRRKQQRQVQHHDGNANDEHTSERKHETTLPEKGHTISTNVMSNIDMWDPHTDNATMSNTNKLIEKRTTRILLMSIDNG
jgi:predicted lipase